MSDFRTFLRDLCERFPGDVVTIEEPVEDPFVPNAMALERDRQARPPLLIFTSLCGSPMPFVTNVFASRDRLAW